jgi:hypothetical protein
MTQFSASRFSPFRVQRRRSKGWRMPENTVSVCRPGKWGNPFPVGKPAKDVPAKYRGIVAADPSQAVELYRQLIAEYGLPLDCDIEELRGKNLACWCKAGEPCHADVLLELANAQGQPRREEKL